MSGWRAEFASRVEVFDVPESIIRMEGLEDMSWHNDVCPSFGTHVVDDSLSLRIWCQAVNVDDREYTAGKRFMVFADAWDDDAWEILNAANLRHLTGEFEPVDEAVMPVLEADDPEDAVRIFITVLAHLQTAVRAMARHTN